MKITEIRLRNRKFTSKYLKATQICSGIACMLLNVALYELLAGFDVSETFINTLFMVIMIVAVWILIGMNGEN